MAEAERHWAEPRWVRYKKHLPPQGIAWKELVAETGESGGEAYYRHRMSEGEHRRIETECITPERLFRETGHKRMYYMDMEKLVGASAGQETNFLYVEYLSSGEVHGRPITVDELRRKGANL